MNSDGSLDVNLSPPERSGVVFLHKESPVRGPITAHIVSEAMRL